MLRTSLMAWIVLLVAPVAHAQSDEEILEKVRANAAKIYREQASFTLPKSFHDSGLAPSDKKRLIEKWANDSARCLAGALALYATTTEMPLKELVNDDLSFQLKGDGSSSEYRLFLDSCLATAWEAVGSRLP